MSEDDALRGKIQFLFDRHVPSGRNLDLSRAVIRDNRPQCRSVSYDHEGVHIIYEAILKYYKGDFDTMIYYHVSVDGNQLINERF
jgi:hypothetical protein